IASVTALEEMGTAHVDSPSGHELCTGEPRSKTVGLKNGANPLRDGAATEGGLLLTAEIQHRYRSFVRVERLEMQIGQQKCVRVVPRPVDSGYGDLRRRFRRGRSSPGLRRDHSRFERLG